MKIRILTIGQKMPAWVLTGFEDYFKRIQPFVQTQIKITHDEYELTFLRNDD